MRRRIKCLIFLLPLILPLIAPAIPAYAENNHTVVRVGWHEPPYFITDESGRKSGYSYEYQRKVAAYTGWEYYSTEDVKLTFYEMIRDYLWIIMAAIAEILLVILILLLRSIRAEKKARDTAVSDTVRRADQIMYENKRIQKSEKA